MKALGPLLVCVVVVLTQLVAGYFGCGFWERFVLSVLAVIFFIGAPMALMEAE